MNLKSLRNSYTSLLDSFKEIGVTLNESQQNSLDNFMSSFETKLNETREEAVQATRKVVEEELGVKYKEAFESLLKHLNEHYTVAANIQTQIAKNKNNDKLVNAIDQFLSEHLDEVLPKKTIVDYNRLQQLERIHESLKNMLVVSESSVESKKEELETAFNNDKAALESEIADLKKKLDDSQDAQAKLNDELSDVKAKNLLESKVKNLPEREAELVRESFKNASVSEINMKFKTVLESVRDDISKSSNDETVNTDVNTEKNLEEAISEIVNTDDSSKENNDTKTTKDVSGEPSENGDELNNHEDDLDESEDFDTKVDEAMMMNWIRMAKGE